MRSDESFRLAVDAYFSIPRVINQAPRPGHGNTMDSMEGVEEHEDLGEGEETIDSMKD